MAKINKTNWTRPAAKLKTNMTTIIILDHPIDRMVTDQDLENIYISPAGNEWPVPMWEVAKGNTMRGLLYSLEDAKIFAEAISVP